MTIEARILTLENQRAAALAAIDADLDEFERRLDVGELPPFPGWDWPEAEPYIAEVDATYSQSQKERALELARRWEATDGDARNTTDET